MRSNDYLKTNGRIIALFFLQYTFLIPVMHYINASIAVAVFSIMLIVWLFINNINHSLIINGKVPLLYVAIAILFLFKAVIGHAGIGTIIYFLIYTVPAGCMFLFPFEFMACMEFMVIVSRFCFLLIFWNPFSSFYSYMRFGYGILPLIILAYVDLVYFNKNRDSHLAKTRWAVLFDYVILIIGSLELLVYGSRGGTFSLMLFIALDRLLINRSNILRNIFIFSLVFIAFENIIPILEFIESISENFGIYSYSITKFKMQISGGFDYASSGRNDIYEASIEKIKASPILGNAISLNETGGHYAHNIFLQVGEDFGIAAIVIITIFLLYCLLQIFFGHNRIELRLLLIIFFSVAIGRLMFSSTLWRRPEFWMLACFALTMKDYQRYLNRNE